jgi:hypothetical protein
MRRSGARRSGWGDRVRRWIDAHAREIPGPHEANHPPSRAGPISESSGNTTHADRLHSRPLHRCADIWIVFLVPRFPDSARLGFHGSLRLRERFSIRTAMHKSATSRRIPGPRTGGSGSAFGVVCAHRGEICRRCRKECWPPPDLETGRDSGSHDHGMDASHATDEIHIKRSEFPWPARFPQSNL